LGCTQEEADQASGGSAQAPRDAWFARGQDPILFWVQHSAIYSDFTHNE